MATAPAPAVVTSADVANSGIKSWQGVICVAEAEDQGRWNTRAKETVKFCDFLPPAPTFGIWGMRVWHGLGGIRRARMRRRREGMWGETDRSIVVIRDVNK